MLIRNKEVSNSELLIDLFGTVFSTFDVPALVTKSIEKMPMN